LKSYMCGVMWPIIMTSKRGDIRVLTKEGLIFCICTSFRVKGMTTLLELKVHYVNTWRNNVKSMHQLGLERVHKVFENFHKICNKCITITTTIVKMFWKKKCHESDNHRKWFLPFRMHHLWMMGTLIPLLFFHSQSKNWLCY